MCGVVGYGKQQLLLNFDLLSTICNKAKAMSAKLFELNLKVKLCNLVTV